MTTLVVARVGSDRAARAGPGGVATGRTGGPSVVGDDSRGGSKGAGAAVCGADGVRYDGFEAVAARPGRGSTKRRSFQRLLCKWQASMRDGKIGK